MNATIQSPIYTPFNQRPSRTETRVLRGGRWQKYVQPANSVLAWLKDESATVVAGRGSMSGKAVQS